MELFGIDAVVSLGATASAQNRYSSQYHNHDWHNDMVHRLVWHIASAYSITLYKRLNSQIDIAAIINHITR